MLGCKLVGIATALALLGATTAGSLAGPEQEKEKQEKAKEKAAELAKRGKLLFGSGDYVEALQRYRAAYALFAHPSYLLNEGYAAEQLGECTLALDAYKRFMSATHPNGNDKDPRAVEHATEAIPRLEKKCGEGAQVIDGGTGGAGTTGAGSGAGASGGAAAPGLTGGADINKSASSSPGGGFRVATYIGGAVTLALLGYYGYEAVRLSSDGHYSNRVIDENNATAVPITGADICANSMIDGADYVRVKDACDAGDAAVLRANITFGVAGVATAATLVFAYFGFIHDFDPAGESGDVTLVPSGPGDVGMSAVVRF